MRLTHLIVVATAAAAVATPAAAPAAFAADAVFGGSTNRGDPIVVRSDPTAKMLRSLTISWRAACDDGRGFPGSSALTPAEPVPGFVASADELLVSRNAKGVFKGTQFAGSDLGTSVVAISVEVAGKLRPARATGTLNAVVKIMDKATGSAIASCESRLRWTTTRKPGIIYGGVTSQGEPIVLRLDSARRRVNDVIVVWRGRCGPSGGFIRVPEHFVGFPIRRTGRFGSPFESETPLDGGGKSRWRYRISGRVTETAASGALAAGVSDTDAAGAATDSCDAGNLTWKAATG